MIKEHIVQGNKQTVIHDFTISQTGMALEISAGTYWNQNKEIYTAESGAALQFDTPAEDTHYEIWLDAEGMSIISRTAESQFGDVTEPIDRLGWFTIPAGATSLDDVEIHCIRMQEVA